MTQRVFDVKNEKDMQDLWDILPDDAKTIEKWDDCYLSGKEPTLFYSDIIKINWHDKTEITRPMEVTEQDIEKLCVFWDDDDELPHYGILDRIDGETYHLRINISPYTECYPHCRKLTKQDIEELI